MKFGALASPGLIGGYAWRQGVWEGARGLPGQAHACAEPFSSLPPETRTTRLANSTEAAGTLLSLIAL